jgi:hypothetical protein
MAGRVPSLRQLARQVSSIMAIGPLAGIAIALAGCVFTRWRTVTGMILASDAVGPQHHSASTRVFVSAAWLSDELGLTVRYLIRPRPEPGTLGLARRASGGGARRPGGDSVGQPDRVEVRRKRPWSPPGAVAGAVPHMIRGVLHGPAQGQARAARSLSGFVALPCGVGSQEVREDLVQPGPAAGTTAQVEPSARHCRRCLCRRHLRISGS